METFYLIDFENVHNEGIENIDSLSQIDHVHIFSTEKALNIRMDLAIPERVKVKKHIVPARKQSVDMHLLSYLGYLLAKHGEQCAYVIVSKDKDYDNIIEFWKKEGYSNTSRKQKIPKASVKQKKNVQPAAAATTQTVNSKISAGMACDFSGSDRCELNSYMQQELAAMGYSGKHVNKICKYVVARCNDERMLSEIHNDLKGEFVNYLEVYDDVKTILEKFVSSKSKSAKRESQVRSFFGQHFKKKIYTDNKEEIIKIIVNAKSKQQINNELMKLYADGKIVKHVLQTIQPLIKELSGQ